MLFTQVEASRGLSAARGYTGALTPSPTGSLPTTPSLNVTQLIPIICLHFLSAAFNYSSGWGSGFSINMCDSLFHSGYIFRFLHRANCISRLCGGIYLNISICQEWWNRKKLIQMQPWRKCTEIVPYQQKLGFFLPLSKNAHLISSARGRTRISITIHLVYLIVLMFCVIKLMLFNFFTLASILI